MKNVCPQCGAAITDEKCPFCGVLFFDFGCIDIDKPFYMKIKHNNKVWRYKVKLTNATRSCDADDTVCYADNSHFLTIPNYHHTIQMGFDIIPEDGIVGYMVDTDVVDKNVKPW